MSRILRRPMFRGGSTSNEGIMSVPRKGYEKAGGVQDFDVSNYYPSSSSVDGGLFGNNEDAYNEYVATSNKDESLSINPKFIKSESADIKQKNKTYKALGQEIEEGSYGDVLLKEYLGNRSDPMGKFLINFGLNYMSARPRGGKFGALTTAADAAKKPTEQLYADQDTDRLLKLKLMGALSKSESKVALEKEAKLLVAEGFYPDMKTALSALMRGRLEQKEESLGSRINKRAEKLETDNKAPSYEVAKSMATFQLDGINKIPKEHSEALDTKYFLPPNSLTKKPNSTDFTLTNAKNLESTIGKLKVGKTYVEPTSKTVYLYADQNTFRPLSKY